MVGGAFIAASGAEQARGPPAGPTHRGIVKLFAFRTFTGDVVFKPAEPTGCSVFVCASNELRIGDIVKGCYFGCHGGIPFFALDDD
jgi:hypothetical protein